MTTAPEAQPAIPPVPPKVAAAIVAVMSEVPKLSKTEKNVHGNYQFASIDGFLEAVRPLCAKHKLIILQDEETFETREGVPDRDGNPTKWLLMRFRFTLAHETGETWDHHPTRTIMVSAKMGSQAFGAAQSYCLKQFLRSLFQIATGEKGQDVDEHPAVELDPIMQAPSAAGGAHGPRNITALKDELGAFARDLAACSDLGMLTVLLNKNDDLLSQCIRDLPHWWYGKTGSDVKGFQERIEIKRTEFEEAELSAKAQDVQHPLEAG